MLVQNLKKKSFNLNKLLIIDDDRLDNKTVYTYYYVLSIILFKDWKIGYLYLTVLIIQLKNVRSMMDNKAIRKISLHIASLEPKSMFKTNNSICTQTTKIYEGNDAKQNSSWKIYHHYKSVYCICCTNRVGQRNTAIAFSIFPWLFSLSMYLRVNSVTMWI